MEGDNTSTESRKEARAACALGAKGVSMKGSVRHSVHIVGPRTAPPNMAEHSFHIAWNVANIRSNWSREKQSHQGKG